MAAAAATARKPAHSQNGADTLPRHIKEGGYTAVTLPAGVLRGARRAARGDWAALLPAGAIIAGLICTAAGYLVGSVRQISHRGWGG